jgi:hypothetical protein
MMHELSQSDEYVMERKHQEAEMKASYSFFLECEVAEMMGFDRPSLVC